MKYEPGTGWNPTIHSQLCTQQRVICPVINWTDKLCVTAEIYKCKR